MIRTLVLFAHIIGMLMLFAGLALELARIEVRRLYGIAFALILFSGIFLAAREAMFPFAWVRVSFAAMLLMAILGASRTRARLRNVSLRVRVALGLAIVFLMISKVAAASSLLVIGLALLVGILTSLFGPRRTAAPTNPSSTGEPVW